MARPVRIEYPGAYYHVTSRGNERKAIFRDDQDREIFLKLLSRAGGAVPPAAARLCVDGQSLPFIN